MAARAKAKAERARAKGGKRYAATRPLRVVPKAKSILREAL